MGSINKIARVAGLLYLMVVPLGIFGSMYVPSRLIVPGDAATTAGKILATEVLFRLGIVSNLLAPLVVLSVVLVLYQVIKPVNKNIARLMVIFVMLGVSISTLNQLTKFAGLQPLSGAAYLKVFTMEQLQALALLFLRLPGNIAAIF